MTVMATGTWRTNGELIADVARLGYLRPEWVTLDATHGLGTFWTHWRPDALVRSDLDPGKGSDLIADMTALPFPDRTFDAVVVDPPYKLNGTPDSAIDARYGVDQPTRWQDRMALCRAAVTEGARVLGDGCLLVKCQDQVCSGKLRWQTVDFTETAETAGLGLVDRFDFPSCRPQPASTRQVTARRCSSQLLVFRRGWRWRDMDAAEADRPLVVKETDVLTRRTA